MVVLDVLHRIQAHQANDLALRWNCKAGKCGSCSMEINGKPRLAGTTRMNVDRILAVRDEFGSGLCNITKCCTEVCPDHIHITDNGIIPLKERVVDRYYDPIAMLMRKIFG